MQRGLDKGTLAVCLELTAHHANWTAFSPPLDEHGKYRIKHIEASLRRARKQLQAIEEIAKKIGNCELSQVLNEKFEFGIK